MKKIIVVLLLLILVSLDVDATNHDPPPRWVEGQTLGVPDSSPAMLPVIFISSVSGIISDTDTWHTVDLSQYIPPDTKAVRLSGLLLITHGITVEVCDLRLSLRNYGEVWDFPYNGQTVEGNVGGGQRSPYADWVGITDGKFQYKWARSTAGEWPTHCSYAINMKLSGYIR